jgi:hypothetical protein
VTRLPARRPPRCSRCRFLVERPQFERAAVKILVSRIGAAARGQSERFEVGLRSEATLEEVAAAVGQALGEPLHEREGLDIGGGVYFSNWRLPEPDPEYQLIRNYSEVEREWRYDDRRDLTYVLRVLTSTSGLDADSSSNNSFPRARGNESTDHRPACRDLRNARQMKVLVSGVLGSLSLGKAFASLLHALQIVLAVSVIENRDLNSCAESNQR